MANGDLNVSIILRFLADQARREMSGAGTDLKTLGAAAEEAGRKAAGAGAAIGQTGTAAQAAAAPLNVLSQATATNVVQSINLTAQMGRNTTAVGGMMNAATGLTRSIKDQVEAMRAEAREAGLLKTQLDEVRARFNPLFAASQQYEMALRDIAEAERMGAISAQEAAAARDRAAQSMAPMNSELRGNAGAANAATAANANLFAQWNDIAVMMAAGQNPMQLALQQGTQVSQVLMGLGGGTTALRAVGKSFIAMLNPISLATIGIIAFGAAAFQWLTSSTVKVLSLDDAMDQLSSRMADYKSAAGDAGSSTASLEERFGAASAEARRLLGDLEKVQASRALLAASDAFRGIATDQGLKLGGAASGFGADLKTLSKTFGLDTTEKAEREAASAVRNAMMAVNSASYSRDPSARLQKMSAAMADLVARTTEAVDLDGKRTAAEEMLLEALLQQNVALLEQAALVDGSGRAEAITRQIDTMVQGYNQQAQLAQAVLQFGENSAQVEALRNRHAREALRIRLEEIGVVQGSADEQRALGELEAAQAAEAGVNTDRRRKAMGEIFTDLRRQQEMSQAILQFGETSAEVEAVRARHADDVLKARLEEMGMAPLLIAMALGLASAERDRARAIRTEAARKSADSMLADLREEAAINAAIAQSGEDSLHVKGLQIAAERRAFEQTLATLEVTAAVKRELLAAWDAARGLASADPFGSLGAGRDYSRGQQERLERLRLEHSLLGQNEAVRTRIVALWQVERDMIREGIDLTSARAAEIRAAAEEEVSLTRMIERQQEAWQKVQSSAESAIDGIVGKLMDGDIDGALEALAGQITGMFTELAVTNPLKNAMLGTNYGTMQDVGGLKGIWGRLTGQADPLTASVSSMGPVASMQVTAASVTIAGPGAMSLMTGAAGGAGMAANTAGAPGAFGGGLGGAVGVQQQVWAFFAAKGLKPHQIAAIMGNVQAESGFNPLAVGDDGTSFGLFQHHKSRGAGLLDATGGMAGLGNVNAQLEYVWKELLTSESGVLKKLLAAPDVQQATSAFVGFERPQGWSAANPMGAHNWAGRVGSAEAALAKFGTTAQTATGNLGTLGTGFDVFGSALAQGLNGAASGGAQGGIVGLLGALAQGIAGKLKIPGFAAGGDFGGGLRVVGENGPELEFTGPSRILNANLTRSIMTSRPPVAANSAPSVIQLQPVLVNNTARQVDLQVEETTDARGQRQQRYVISDVVGDGLATPGGKAARNMSQLYNVKKPARRRS
ncbi:phage tail tip lysozyme [Pseudotabrizicola algicola]|uniref:Phage tail lysozyme domain-containing protein n=1 Tax=Pseudotabrizicola algicola TaxID=2709381 RepID=A0A6B3RRZ1_9RHOB|nr:phage tail tip lysozyme [Pseudotabrizicola algicola]NEX47598.1 hypothetical protein [Pseudotabrizicola algicola]